MPNFNDMIEVIKQAANDAADARQDADFCYGTVISASPLKISVEQKMTLTSAQLVLSRNVTNFETEVTIAKKYGWVTQQKGGGVGEASFSSHDHDISGTWKIQINNGLKKGDQVMLMRKKGGQEYFVIDRVVKT